MTTYWSRPIAPDIPPYLQVTRHGVAYLLLYWPDVTTLTVYEKLARRWERSAVFRDPAEIVAALPSRATQPDLPTDVATEKQIVALRKLIALPTGDEMPTLSKPACSRLLDHVIVASAIAAIRQDARRWASGEEQAA